MLREKLRNRKGFTLIEIIVVIVILAVLMAIAVPSVMSYINEGNNAKYQSIARAVLVNSQTEVAKAVANGGIKATDKEVSSTTHATSDDKSETLFNKIIKDHTYTGADTNGIEISSITLTGTDHDVKQVVCKITINNDQKTATVSANKEVTIS